MDRIARVHERVRLREGEGVIEKFLLHLLLHTSASTKELARELMLPIPVATAIKKELIREGLARQGGGVELSPEGLEFLRGQCGYRGADIAKISALLGSGGAREELIGGLSARYEGLFAERPAVDVTVDQAKATAGTSFRRAMLCLASGCLIGKRVLCVGDDDYVSVALGLLLREIFPDGCMRAAQITVFDIDERYIQAIRGIAAEHGLPIECARVDLTEPLPLNLANGFDCFFTDPPYTLGGLSLFLSRGTGALKKKKGLKVFLSFGKKSADEELRVQETILAHGYAVQGIIDGLNRYEGASLLGNASRMYILESTERVASVIPADAPADEPIYTHSRTGSASVYICAGCGERIHLGRRTDIGTIERLKEAGCPSCGGTAFRLERKTPPRAVPAPKKSLGEHILADFYGCDRDFTADPAAIRRAMIKAARISGARVVSEEFHAFEPWGVSGVIVLKESHLTIHTWPEHRYAAVDIFTCGSGLQLREAFDYMKEAFRCERVDFNDIARGTAAVAARETAEAFSRD